MIKIAVIDDDVYIGDLLEELLLREGYQVLRAYSGTEALLLLSSIRPDLVLLDLMLPGLSGEDVLAQINGIPVVILSAKADVQDKVNLLLGGAADYVTKPFDTEELLARISVQLRNAALSVSQPVLAFEDLTLHVDTHQVQHGDHFIRLTKTEYAILKLLMQNPQQVITKSQILERIAKDTPDCMESSLKVHISNLRKKLREYSEKDYIEAVWGIGFKMRESGS
ncbi:response regulator transcription factor [Diplocloster agilis]|uniref:response regulator transcription factor n=1 Tax=Diplocloster agilis TaxID=2850323 RepID=UPI0008209746|nr:response regulator transcription factor [Suonthocola fibrivorans]MCU6734108.1 response regulator transcription factor [Suonthocola fibrivorans]SCJ24077.1 Mycobacterial persistence regulator A [uncultured Clostridium sp.]